MFLPRPPLRLSFVFGLLSLSLCQGVRAQLSTEDHVAEPGFWPTQAQASAEGFVGEKACAGCHNGIARSQVLTSMARTAVRATPAALPQGHGELSFRSGPDRFAIQSTAQASSYEVTDGKASATFPLLWIFGTGRVGQSYLFEGGSGHMHEARVTYFESTGHLGFTPARPLEDGADLQTVAGRKVETPELIRCFNCHATAVNVGGHFNESGLIGGVTCEACHSPGAEHVARMRQPAGAGKGGAGGAAIFETSHLSPTESVEFCGACHGSWWDVKLAHVTGPSTVRSAPYRLVTSRCWGPAGDPRLTCTACHDPHKEVVTEPASYDGACLQCHGGQAAGAGAKAVSAAVTGAGHPASCPVAKTRCVSCHMPKVFVPEMQHTFTDHRIRVVRPGEAFRD